MAGLPTDKVVLVLEHEGQTVEAEFMYGDFFSVVYAKALDAFGISLADQAKYALFDQTGSRVPKTTKMMDNAEIVDGCKLILRPR